MRIAQEEIKRQLDECNQQQKEGKFTNYKSYLRKFNSIKNQNTLTNQAKRFGAKMEREFAGYYIYHGVNFKAKFNQESCETTWWEVNLYEDGFTRTELVEEFTDNNNFETYEEVLNQILCLDCKIGEEQK